MAKATAVELKTLAECLQAVRDKAKQIPAQQDNRVLTSYRDEVEKAAVHGKQSSTQALYLRMQALESDQLHMQKAIIMWMDERHQNFKRNVQQLFNKKLQEMAEHFTKMIEKKFACQSKNGDRATRTDDDVHPSKLHKVSEEPVERPRMSFSEEADGESTLDDVVARRGSKGANAEDFLEVNVVDHIDEFKGWRQVGRFSGTDDISFDRWVRELDDYFDVMEGISDRQKLSRLIFQLTGGARHFADQVDLTGVPHGESKYDVLKDALSKKYTAKAVKASADNKLSCIALQVEQANCVAVGDDGAAVVALWSSRAEVRAVNLRYARLPPTWLA